MRKEDEGKTRGYHDAALKPREILTYRDVIGDPLLPVYRRLCASRADTQSL